MRPHNGIYTQKYRNTSTSHISIATSIHSGSWNNIISLLCFSTIQFFLSCRGNYHSKRTGVVKTPNYNYQTKTLHASIREPIAVKICEIKLWKCEEKKTQRHRVISLLDDFQPRNSLRNFSCCWLGFADTLCVHIVCGVVWCGFSFQNKKGVCVQVVRIHEKKVKYKINFYVFRSDRTYYGARMLLNH